MAEQHPGLRASATAHRDQHVTRELCRSHWLRAGSRRETMAPGVRRSVSSNGVPVLLRIAVAHDTSTSRSRRPLACGIAPTSAPRYHGSMNDTIRAYIKRRVRWLFAVGVFGWLVFPLSAFLRHDEPGGKLGPALPAVGMLVFVGAILALNWAIKCPRCRANLGRTIAMPLGLSWGSGAKINFCPYCGVNLDEPRAPHTPAAPPTPFNPIR